VEHLPPLPLPLPFPFVPHFCVHASQQPCPGLAPQAENLEPEALADPLKRCGHRDAGAAVAAFGALGECVDRVLIFECGEDRERGRGECEEESSEG
jgi:hypothetical protein